MNKYHEMKRLIIDRAEEWNTGRIQPEDVWDVAFREGIYNELTESQDLAFEFLLITDRGPTWHYQKYLNMADSHFDVLALVALSALVNDALH